MTTADGHGNMGGGVDQALVTEELLHRPSRPPDHEAESRALVMLAQEMAVHPDGVLQKLVELVLDLCHAGSAGVSILEPGGGDGIFRWHAAAGACAAHHLDATMPGEASTWATVIDRDTVLLLFDQVKRFFPALRGVEPRIQETLLAPWHRHGKPVGILWAIAHEPDRRFDAEDARLLASLARFAAAAYQTVAARDAAEAARRELERRVEERSRALIETSERLRASEARVRATLGIGTVGVVFFDDAGRITDANDAFLAMVGFTREELEAGLVRYDLLTPPEWLWKNPEVLAELKTTGQSTPFEKEYFRKDGSRIWILCAGKLLDEGSAVEFILDVSERKRAEAALRQSEERQSFLLRLSDALRPLADPVAIQSAASRLLADHLDASRAYYAEAHEDSGIFVIRSDYVRGDTSSRVGVYRLDDFAPVGDLLRAGQVVVIGDTLATQGLSPAVGERYAALAVRAQITVPLVKAGKLVAALTVSQASPRAWTSLEVYLVEETAERTWAAVERANAEAALRESEERFRSFAETSADVLWILDVATGRLEYLSPAFETVWGEPREAVMADLGRWAELVHADDRERVLEGLPRLLRGEAGSFVADYRIVRPDDGSVRWIRDTGFTIRDRAGAVRRVGGIAQDFTEVRDAADRVRASERRLRSLIEGIPQLVWRAGKAGEWTWASPQWHGFTGLSDEASHGHGWLAALHPDDRGAAMAAWERAEAENGFEAEYRLRHAPSGRYRWFQTRATPVRGEAGEVLEWLGTSTDVDELRELQDRQRLLLAELQHRVRNTLGIVRSIARRTAATSASVEAYAMHLDGRLNAFARTQSMVTRDPSAGVDLELLVAEELQAHTAREGDRIHIGGPTVRFRAKAAETIGLAVHELATNAIEHGALACPDGRIEVTWRVDGSDRAGPARLCFSWAETGGPGSPAAEPRRGFGTELLERTLAYELKARTRLAFEPNGLRCTINLPLTPRVAVGLGGHD